jgi:hypothetical protein
MLTALVYYPEPSEQLSNHVDSRIEGTTISVIPFPILDLR